MFRKRTSEEIETKIRADERAKVEKFYLAELEKQRERNLIQYKKDLNKIVKEYQDRVEDIKNKSIERIAELKDEIRNLNVAVFGCKKAWSLYKRYIPRAVALTEAINNESMTELIKRIKKHKEAEILHEDAEVLMRSLMNITPKVEKRMTGK